MASKPSAITDIADLEKNPHQLTIKESPPSSPSLDSPHSTESNRYSLAFTKAAFAFRENLEKARHKRDTTTTVASAPASTSTPDDPEKLAIIQQDAKFKRRIRVVRVIQNLLTSVLSLLIAILQGRTYQIYEQTKSVDGAWPAHPNLLPTLILFATALVALTFDSCTLVAYFSPNTNIGRKAFKLAVSTQNVSTTIKGVAYAMSTVVCRTSFNQGNDSGQNDDLWSWSCGQAAMKESNVNQCTFNCKGNTAAWVMAIVNIGIELCGVILNQLASQQTQKTALALASAPADTIAKDTVVSPAVASPPPTASKIGLSDDELDQLDKLGGEMSQGLKDQTKAPEKTG